MRDRKSSVRTAPIVLEVAYRIATLTGLVLTIMKERGTGSRGEAGGIFGGLDA